MFQKAGRGSRDFTADDVKIDVKKEDDDGGHHGEFQIDRQIKMLEKYQKFGSSL